MVSGLSQGARNGVFMVLLLKIQVDSQAGRRTECRCFDKQCEIALAAESCIMSTPIYQYKTQQNKFFWEKRHLGPFIMALYKRYIPGVLFDRPLTNWYFLYLNSVICVRCGPWVNCPTHHSFPRVWRQCFFAIYVFGDTSSSPFLVSTGKTVKKGVISPAQKSQSHLIFFIKGRQEIRIRCILGWWVTVLSVRMPLSLTWFLHWMIAWMLWHILT